MHSSVTEDTSHVKKIQTFSTISTDQEGSAESLLDLLPALSLDDMSSNTISILFDVEELSIQFDKHSIFFDMSSEDFFSMVLPDQNPVCLRIPKMS